MPNADQFVQIGQVLKSNGTDGQVVIGLRGIDAGEISEMEPVFIFFDELPVPYFLKIAGQRGPSKILAYMTDTATLEDAEELAGRAIYMREADMEDDAMEDFTGWELFSSADPALHWTVTGIEDIPGNPCIIIDNNGEEALLPLHEDLILEIDPERRRVVMTIPEGLL